MAGSVTLAVLAFCTVHALPIATDLPRAGATLASAAAGRAGAPSDDRALIARHTNAAVADDADGVARRENAPTAAPRGRDLRIAAASTLPIELPFSRFSPLSRLTNAQLAASRTTPAPAAAAPDGSSPRRRHRRQAAHPRPWLRRPLRRPLSRTPTGPLTSNGAAVGPSAQRSGQLRQARVGCDAGDASRARTIARALWRASAGINERGA